jgi:hypothetical protein
MKDWLRRLCLLLIVTILPALLSGCLFTMLQVVNTGEGGSLAYGETVWGNVSDSFGQEWTFFGRAGDVVTVTMSSNQFDTYVELYGPVRQRWYKRNNNGKELNTDSRIPKYKLPHTGTYVIVAAGQSSTMSGTYSLTLQSPPAESSNPLCVISAPYLAMRSGPGADNTQPVRLLRQNAQLRTISRDDSGNWIEVLVEGSVDRGWITTNSNYIQCDRSIEILPMRFDTITLNQEPLGKNSQ